MSNIGLLKVLGQGQGVVRALKEDSPLLNFSLSKKALILYPEKVVLFELKKRLLCLG
jgi:hypothetical protein